MTDRELLKILNDIKKNNFALPANISKMELTENMLRVWDEVNTIEKNVLIYEIFYYWISVKKVYNVLELHKILTTVLVDECLFHKISSTDPKDVYTRNLSVLIIGLVLNIHRKESLFSEEMFFFIKTKLIKYYSLERSLKSYFDEYGWLHGMNHGPDARDELIQCSECTIDVCYELLDTIKNNLYRERYIYGYEEDEYLTVILYRMLELKFLNTEDLLKWLKDLSNIEMKITRQHYINYINVRNLIRSFYFRVLHKESFNSLAKSLLNLEKYMNRFLD